MAVFAGIFSGVLLCFSFVRCESDFREGDFFPNTSLVGNDVSTYDITLSMDNPREYISSPGFPHEYYPPNIQIIYNIKIKLDDEVSQLSTRVILNFEMFAVDDSEFCARDGLEVSDPSKQVRVFCGSQVGRTILSESSSITVRFFTDSSGGSRGYSIRLEMFNTGCSSTFLGTQSGEFSSPNFPGRYYSEDLCVWKIQAPAGKIIRVKFNNVFDIRAYEPLCVQDFLAVSRSGDFIKDVTRYCHGTKPNTIESEGTSMLFMFRTDCCFEGKGFKATFAIIDAIDVATTTLPPPPPPNECSCGEENSELERIVGGITVDPPNKYPWVVGLINSKNQVICGGALINTQYVLTASHCLERETTSTIRVALGIHNVDTSPTPVPVSTLIIHPQYANRTYINDIGLIKLKDPVTFDSKVRSVCLPERKNFPTDSDDAVVAGWGRDMEGGKESNVLQEVGLPIVSNAFCVSKYGGVILETNLCAGGEEAKDACQGDSGGALFTMRDDYWYAVGLSSWGIGCGRKGHPGVFTRVSQYQDWIADETRDAPPCNAIEPPLYPNIPDCGIPNTKPSERIAGGTETLPFEYPWIALVVYNRTVEGAGALISPYYVLTAASVFDEWMEWYPEVLDVFLGEHDLTKKESFTQRLQVERVFHHPQYGRPTPYNNDLALLKLKVPSNGLPRSFRPICLPRASFWYPEGLVVTTAGWGRTSTNGPGSTVLLKTDLDIVPLQKCSDIYPGWITNKMLCATRVGKDTCKGDSGAPLMRCLNGRFYLSGVSSWGPKEGCAIRGMPRVFSAIYRNLLWISDYTGLTVA